MQHNCLPLNVDITQNSGKNMQIFDFDTENAFYRCCQIYLTPLKKWCLKTFLGVRGEAPEKIFKKVVSEKSENLLGGK